MDGFTKTLIAIGSPIALFVLATGALLLTGNEVGAAITGTITAALVVAFTHVLAFTAGAHYTRGTMLAGADVALRAQDSNDRWDERKTETLGRIFREGASAGRRVSGGGDELAALPLPSQGPGDWAPQLAAYRIED